MPQRWFRRHPKKLLLATGLLGLVLVLILTELGVRVARPQWRPTTAERVDFWVYDEVLGWAHRPGEQGRFVHPEFDVDVRINADGLRDDDYALERTEKKRMLVLGDSFGWGFGVEHHERFSEILESRHPDWEIINASVSGYGTGQQWLYLSERGIQYRPDVVLLLFYENDYGDIVDNEVCRYYKPYFLMGEGGLELRNVPVPTSTIKQRLERFVYGRTWLYSKLYALLAAEDPNPYRWAPGKFVVTVEILKRMDALCREKGARFTVVSVPMVDPKRREFLEKVCKAHGILHLALDHDFSRVRERTTFPSDRHWSRIGHRHAAKFIERFLGEMGIFDFERESRRLILGDALERAQAPA